MSFSEKPFTIDIPDRELELLQQKLALTRLPDEINDAGWDYGAPLGDVRRLVEHWKTSYNWRTAEAALNADLPQFTRDVEVEDHGVLNVHYVHRKSTLASAIPLMFVHGWPGSIIEVRKILPLLVAPPTGKQAFHVVALGLPGYGFSEAPKKGGFGPEKMAEAGHNLMQQLGYDEYVVQGGDWGYFITRAMASKYGPRHVKAWHTNMPFATFPHPLSEPLRFLSFMVTPLSAAERLGLERAKTFEKIEIGYLIQQSTKPQTVGYGLSDSPVALLAWIYEKLVTWSDSYPWTDDEVLTWVSIYWFSRGGPTSAARLYFENRTNIKRFLSLKTPTVPTGYSYFPRDIMRFPRTWSLHPPNIVQETEHEAGGHFAAYKVPELLVSDLRKMFGVGGPAHGVVPAKL